MNSTPSIEEQRKEYRYPSDANVEVYTSENKRIFAACCNISRTGIMIKSDEEFSPSEPLKLKIIEAGSIMIAEAIVVHCESYKHGYYSGCTANFLTEE